MTGGGTYAYIYTVAKALVNDDRHIHDFIDLLDSGKYIRDEYTLPELKENTLLIFFWPQGKVVRFLTVHDNWITSNGTEGTKFYAWGSGEEYAMGAMAAGKSAIEAVKISCKFDDSSGGKVQHVRVA